MENFQYLFSDTKLAQRSIIFCASVVIVITFCVFHGISGRMKSIHRLDQMLENGNLTGKFWTVIKVQADQRIAVTKYQRIITLAGPLTRNAQIGDKISFTTKLENADYQSAPLWHLTKIRFHGMSFFKYGISVLSVLLVLMMGFKYFKFDRKSFSLTFKERQC